MYEHRDDIPPSPPDTDGDVSQRRLRWGLLAAVAVVLVAAIPGILRGSGDSKEVTSAQDLTPGTTTTTGAGVVAGVPMFPVLSTTTSVPAGGVTPLQTGTTLPPAATTTAPAPPPPPPAAPPCRNSFDPACGAFRWDPDPGPNAPLTVTVTPPTQQGNTTSSVNFHIVAHDPDAKVAHCYSVDYGDGLKETTCPPSPSCQTPYGPWTPPGKVDDQYVTDVQHKYATPSPPGQPYVASFTLQSHSFCYPDPYGGSAQGSAQVTVLP
jgi:hypothetical protein